MKRIIRTIAASFITALLVTACNQTSKTDMKEAQQNLDSANNNLKNAINATNDTAKANATADWKKFKTDADNNIADLEKQVKALQAKLTKANKKEKEKLNVDVDKTNQKLEDFRLKLNKRNTEFETEIYNFDEKVSAKNESFKREFKNDMVGLDSAIKDLFKDNLK